MDQSLKDEYFRRYTEIKSFVIRAFYDIFILEAFESYNTETSSGKKSYIRPSYLVVKHLCQVVMEDLALSICKVYNDQSKKGHEANTLFQLNSFIYTKFYKDQVPKVKKKLADEIVTTLIRIKEMGHQFPDEQLYVKDDFVYLGDYSGFNSNVIYATQEALAENLAGLDRKLQVTI